MSGRATTSSEGPRVAQLTVTRLPDEVIEAMFLLTAAAAGFLLNLVVIT